jgi:Pectate lyase superfamily protein
MSVLWIFAGSIGRSVGLYVFFGWFLLIPAEALSATFNVRDYGVIGDGTAPDVARLQHVLGLARAAGGGDIYFPEGIYLVPKDGFLLTLDEQQNLTIRGDGPEATVWQLQRNSNVQIISAALRLLNQNERILIRDLKIVGTFRSYGDLQAEQGVRLETQKPDDVLDGLTVENLRLEYLGNNGIFINNYTDVPNHTQPLVRNIICYTTSLLVSEAVSGCTL